MAAKKKGSALGKSRYAVDIATQQTPQPTTEKKAGARRQTLNAPRDVAERLADAAWFMRETKQDLLVRYIREGLKRDAERIAQERGEQDFDFKRREVRGKRWK